MYDKQTFKNKITKRQIEDSLTLLKNSRGKGVAISLTGPDIDDHIVNYKKANFSHVFVAELDDATYYNMSKDPYYLKNQNYMTLQHVNVFKMIKEVSKTQIITEIDLDFTRTIGTLLPELTRNIPLFRESWFTKRFTIITTFCNRQARHKKDRDLLTLNTMINNLSWCNIRTLYYKNYKDYYGAPMYTQMFDMYKNDGLKKYHSLEWTDF